MKRVASGTEPEILAAFRAENPDGTWSEFKNEPGSEAVFESLAAAQGFICAYCEIDIRRPLRGEVEHFLPKSQSTTDRNLHLEFGNLLACCEGGTWSFDPERSEPPIAATCHCGALKGDQSPTGRVLDPRTLPATLCIWKIEYPRLLRPDHEACQSAGIDPAIAESTVELLGLNRRVLSRLRSTVVEELDRYAFEGPHDGDDQSRMAAIAEELLPRDGGQLIRFWSTVRAWAGPTIEPFLAAPRE